MAAPLRILISGGGIAGPATAFWLSRLGHKCTIIERHDSLRIGGQQIDLRGPGVATVKHMGLLEEVRKHVVDEQGAEFIDVHGKRKAFFPKSPPGELQSFTSEYEIMRGDLCQVFFDAIKETVEYRFGLSVEDFKDEGDTVTVTLSDGSVETYDLVIAADGFNSRIRKKMLADHGLPDTTRSLETFFAFYNLERQPEDKDVLTACILPGERLAAVRWHSKDMCQGYLGTMSRLDELRESMRNGTSAQQELLAQIFEDSGVLGARLVQGMMKTDDFYMAEIAQLTGKCWSKGNVVLVGDAGYCPSPFTGMGTSIAIVGAYVLAGEISKNPGNLSAALESYDKTLRPYVDEIQKMPPGAPGIMYPRSAWGVRLANFLIGTVSKLKVDRIINSMTSAWDGKGRDWKLPVYPTMLVEDGAKAL